MAKTAKDTRPRAQHVLSMLVSAVRSALVMVRLYELLTWIQLRAYVHRNAVTGGDHRSGLRSPLDRFVLAETAHSCGPDRSLAKASRRAAVHVEAPEIHALASGTMWSMSTDDDCVTVTPSYGLNHVPDVGWHALSVLTPAPSRTSTVSRESHVPDTMCQWRNRLRS